MSANEQITRGTEKGTEFVESRSTRIRTVEELIAETKLDLDKFEIERGVVNKWEVGTALKTLKRQGLTGDYVQAGSVLVEPLFQVKIYFKPKDMRLQLMAELHQKLIADIKSFAPGSHPIPPIKKSKENFMLEVGITDLHVGKLAVAEETGEHYSIKRASEVFEQAVLAAIADSSHLNISKILWPIGNDMLHFDDSMGNTTKGTPVSHTGRYFQLYRSASKLYRWAIERSLEVAPVKFITVPGNHDFKSVFHLGEELAAWYGSSPHVVFDNQATPRKYHRHGVNLIGFTHGSEENLMLLGPLMAKEAKADWARTTQHEWHLGHIHRSRIVTESLTGVRVRWLPSMSSADAWHHKKGFIDRRSSEAYIWGDKTGYKGHWSYNVL